MTMSSGPSSAVVRPPEGYQVVPNESWLPRETRFLWNSHPNGQKYEYTRPERCSAESILTDISGRSPAPDNEVVITQTQTSARKGQAERDARTLSIALRDVGSGPLYFKALVNGQPSEDPVSTLKTVMSFLCSADSRPVPRGTSAAQTE